MKSSHNASAAARLAVVLALLAGPAQAQSVILTRGGAGPVFRLGWSVADAGDVDGDGRSDIIVGAPDARDPSGALTGAAYVYTSSGTLLY